jgi:hypothetical protein
MIANAKMMAATRVEVFRNEVIQRLYRSDCGYPGPRVDKPEDLEGSRSATPSWLNGSMPRLGLCRLSQSAHDHHAEIETTR